METDLIVSQGTSAQLIKENEGNYSVVKSICKRKPSGRMRRCWTRREKPTPGRSTGNSGTANHHLYLLFNQTFKI